MSSRPRRHSRKTDLSADRRLLYLDSSALVKLVIREPHRAELREYLHRDDVLATSRLALVEVPRAVALASSAEAVEEVERMLASCLLVDVSDRLLRDARALASRQIRTLDAIHLASALHVDADELVAYDRRLLAAAEREGVRVAAPGLR